MSLHFDRAVPDVAPSGSAELGTPDEIIPPDTE